MTRLTIFFDPHCGLCSRFRQWMERQHSYLVLDFVPYDSETARKRLPELAAMNPEREIVVLADDGSVWQGPGAWVTCLWALHGWRHWAQRLASPALLPLASKVCHLVSENRMAISHLLGLKEDVALAGELERMPAGDCDIGMIRPRGPGRRAMAAAKEAATGRRAP